VGAVSSSGSAVYALHAALVDALLTQGAIRTESVAEAFRMVPRHVFAPEVPVPEAYADDIVRTKRDERGATTSSVSAPWLQATMLEQAQLAPGMRVLEIGSGGYQAALLAELVGPTGQVTTVDIDRYVTDRAHRFLAEAGYPQVNVVHADAEQGVADHAPFDRIFVTTGAWNIPSAWVQQLAIGGRIIVPLRLRGLSRAVAFDRESDHLVSRDHVMAGFVPMQGAGARAEHVVAVHGQDVGVRVDEAAQPVDADLRLEQLLQPRVQAWSGVRFGAMEPFDGLSLWLATCISDFCLLWREDTEVARDLVAPASRQVLHGADGGCRLAHRAGDALRATCPAPDHYP
jgi:protein-L-isoaspartate(D-aspartate) O-methyltransferase